MSTSEPSTAAPAATTTQQQATSTPASSTSTTTDKQKEKAALAKAKKKKKEKAKKKAKRAKKNTLKTKIVVRRLPPNLPEEALMNAAKRWIGDDVVDYKFYVPGKLSQSKGKENVFSRAYFHMKSMEAVIAFHQGFDGHIFLDSKGTESRAVVEFAPFQKVPKEHKNPDTRQGTIDEDPDYLKFVESLKAEENKAAEPKEVGETGSQLERLENRLALVTAQTLAAEQANKPKTTPLLDHLRAQKAAQAAAKAKAQAAKAAKKKAAAKEAKEIKAREKAAASASVAGTAEEGAAGSEREGKAKKPSRRNKKKKDQDKKAAAAAAAGGAVEANGSDTTKASSKESTSNSKPNKPPKEKGDKPKKPRPSRNREGKESKNNKQGKQQQQQQPVVQILGRGNKEDSSSKPKSSANQRAG